MNAIKILLIDDDADDFVILSDLLKKTDIGSYEFEWQNDMERSRQAIREGTHDLFLIDYRLGASTGLDLIQLGIDSEIFNPMILLTGYGDKEIDHRALALGAADYLVKSELNVALLERCIRYSLKRANALREVREQKLRFQSLFDHTFEGIVLHETDGTMIDVNKSAEQLLGCQFVKADRLETRNLLSYFDRPLAPALLSLFQRCEGNPIEATARRGDQSNCDVEVSTKEYLHRGRKVCLTSLRDISERKQMEAQILHQDRLASAGLLASSLAHEIGTPLGVIRGRAEILEYQVGSDAALKKNLDIIIAQIDRVSKLIRNLLNLTRNETPAALGPVTLRPVILEVLDFVSHDLKKYSIRAEVEVSEVVSVIAEAESLHQVFLNLIMNSVHAISEAIATGKATGHFLKISAQPHGEGCSVSVADSGVGISAENLKHLFKPFFTTKGVGQGTGLGLATSYRLMSNWGGSIGVKSQVNCGTTFILNFVSSPRSTSPTSCSALTGD